MPQQWGFIYKKMDNQASFGSGSALLGGTDALTEAMQRRQSGSGQVSSAAPTYNPQTAPVTPPTSSAGVSPSSTQSVPGMTPNVGESTIIIKALESRLKSLSKLAEQTGGQVGL